MAPSENSSADAIAASPRDEDPTIMLGLLSAVERDSLVTQRSLSRELGIALGLANAYIRRAARKGLIKISQAPLNRYMYYLTPQGFAEKSRLTTEYLTLSFNFFREARRQCTSLLAGCAARGWRRGVLVGAGELAEIAVLSAGEADVEILGVVDAAQAGGRCAGRPILETLAPAAPALAGGFEFVLLTDLAAPQATLALTLGEATRAGLAAERVLAPALLRVVYPAPQVAEAAR